MDDLGHKMNDLQNLFEDVKKNLPKNQPKDDLLSHPEAQNLSNQWHKLNKDLDRLKHRSESLEEVFERKNQQLDQSREESDALRKEIVNLDYSSQNETRVESLVDNLRSLNSTMDSHLEVEIEKLRRRLIDLKRFHHEELGQLSAAIESAETTLRQIDENPSELGAKEPTQMGSSNLDLDSVDVESIQREASTRAADSTTAIGDDLKILSRFLEDCHNELQEMIQKIESCLTASSNLLNRLSIGISEINKHDVDPARDVLLKSFATKDQAINDALRKIASVKTDVEQTYDKWRASLQSFEDEIRTSATTEKSIPKTIDQVRLLGSEAETLKDNSDLYESKYRPFVKDPSDFEAHVRAKLGSIDEKMDALLAREADLTAKKEGIPDADSRLVGLEKKVDGLTDQLNRLKVESPIGVPSMVDNGLLQSALGTLLRALQGQRLTENLAAVKPNLQFPSPLLDNPGSDSYKIPSFQSSSGSAAEDGTNSDTINRKINDEPSSVSRFRTLDDTKKHLSFNPKQVDDRSVKRNETDLPPLDARELHPLISSRDLSVPQSRFQADGLQKFDDKTIKQPNVQNSGYPQTDHPIDGEESARQPNLKDNTTFPSFQSDEQLSSSQPPPAIGNHPPTDTPVSLIRSADNDVIETPNDIDTLPPISAHDARLELKQSSTRSLSSSPQKLQTDPNDVKLESSVSETDRSEPIGSHQNPTSPVENPNAILDEIPVNTAKSVQQTSPNSKHSENAVIDNDSVAIDPLQSTPSISAQKNPTDRPRRDAVDLRTGKLADTVQSELPDFKKRRQWQDIPVQEKLNAGELLDQARSGFLDLLNAERSPTEHSASRPLASGSPGSGVRGGSDGKTPSFYGNIARAAILCYQSYILITKTPAMIRLASIEKPLTFLKDQNAKFDQSDRQSKREDYLRNIDENLFYLFFVDVKDLLNDQYIKSEFSGNGYDINDALMKPEDAHEFSTMMKKPFRRCSHIRSAGPIVRVFEIDQ